MDTLVSYLDRLRVTPRPYFKYSGIQRTFLKTTDVKLPSEDFLQLYSHIKIIILWEVMCIMCPELNNYIQLLCL